MRKLFLLFGVFILFVSLLGATNALVPTREPEKAVPGKSFGAGKGLSATSTEGPGEVAPKPELKVFSQSEGIADPLASGGNPEKSVALSKMRALSDVIDSLVLINTQNNGNEWNGRYIYIGQSRSGDSSMIRVFDPEDGSTVDEWELPFMGNVFGIAFVNNSMYVSDWTNGMIRKVDPSTHALLASFSAPGGYDVRGITSDGENLYIGAAGSIDSIYLADTLCNRLNAWYIGAFCDWVMDIAYASRDGAIWLIDDNTNQIMKVALNGSATLLEAFTPPGNPASNVGEGISFDGSDLWFNTYYSDKIYRIDGGYSRSRIALFQNNEPWGYRSIKDILYDSGIPFKVFDTTDIGNADLSIYTKAIIPGQQDSLMGVVIAANKTWWENWISNGGVLQISGATYWDDNWEGLILPGDFSCISSSATSSDTLNIVSNWHPLVNDPYPINGAELSDWDSSTHGYFVGITGHYTVIEDTLGRPVLAIKRLGNGGIIATVQPLEYAWDEGYSTILENVIKYWQYGVTTNVLFALADNDQPWTRNALIERDSLIGNVDYMDVRNYTPLLEDLNMYDVVLTHPNNQYYNNIATGDTLAAYVDSGGKVVLGAACWYGPPFGLAGAIMDPAYNPFYTPSGGNYFSYANLGWYDATHPMMDGVTTLSEYYRDYLQVNPGADTVAKYDDGEYLLGFKTQGSDGLVVGFNTMFRDTLSVDYTYGWSGQMVKLLSNIIDWSALYSGIEDVTEGEKGFSILEISSPILTGKEWFTLSIDSPTSVELRIINVAGMVVSSTSLNYTTPGIKKVDFDVSKLPSGPYFLSLKTDKGNAIKKAMIIR